MSHSQKTVLENGIRVVTETVPSTRTVALGVFIEVGSSSEEAHQEGITHLCEHLTFQGTSSRDALEIARTMDSAGGRVGGFTGRDYTCYNAVVLDDYYTFAVDLLGDVLLNPVFPLAAIEREKQAISCELGAAVDDPARLAHVLPRCRENPSTKEVGACRWTPTSRTTGSRSKGGTTCRSTPSASRSTLKTSSL